MGARAETLPPPQISQNQSCKRPGGGQDPLDGIDPASSGSGNVSCTSKIIIKSNCNPKHKTSVRWLTSWTTGAKKQKASDEDRTWAFNPAWAIMRISPRRVVPQHTELGHCHQMQSYTRQPPSQIPRRNSTCTISLQLDSPWFLLASRKDDRHSM